MYSTAPKVLLVTDDFTSGRTWSFALSQQGIESILTGTIAENADWRNEAVFDLVVIDIYASAINAIDLARQLHLEMTIPILTLMPEQHETLILEAYDAGVDECIPKPISPRLFLAKVRAWLRRAQTIPVTLLDSFQIAEFQLDPARRQLLLPENEPVKLSNLEFRLLHLLMTHPGQILETSILIDRVWGYRTGGDSTLLKNLVYRLRRKVEADPSQPQHIHSIAGEGYLFQP